MKLKDLYPKLGARERKNLASRAGIAPGYLWQLATGWRGRKPSLALMTRLAKADKRLKVAHLAEEFSEPRHPAEASHAPEMCRG